MLSVAPSKPSCGRRTMDKEDIIRMAREAGLDPDLWNYTDAFERFAVLVAAAEREKVRSAMKRAFRRMAGLIRADEREAVAKMFDEPMILVPFVQNHLGGCMVCGFTPKMAANAIRARGETT